MTNREELNQRCYNCLYYRIKILVGDPKQVLTGEPKQVLAKECDGCRYGGPDRFVSAPIPWGELEDDCP